MTLRTQMSGLRVFLQWAGSIEAMPENLYQKVVIPRVPREERRRTEMLDSDRAQETHVFINSRKMAHPADNPLDD
jgi:hypothetical protein